MGRGGGKKSFIEDRKKENFFVVFNMMNHQILLFTANIGSRAHVFRTILGLVGRQVLYLFLGVCILQL